MLNDKNIEKIVFIRISLYFQNKRLKSFEGGLHHFDKSLSKNSRVYMHQNESSILLHPNQMLRNFKTASWVTPEEIVIKPSYDWSSRNYQVNPLSDAIPVRENFEFDLGNFRFKVHLKDLMIY